MFGLIASFSSTAIAPATLRSSAVIALPSRVVAMTIRPSRARSASYVPKQGPRAEELGARLDALFDRFQGPDGRVRLRFTDEHRAELPAGVSIRPVDGTDAADGGRHRSPVAHCRWL